MKFKGTWKLGAVAVAACLLAPGAARADFTALTSPAHISGTVFTFEEPGLTVGFVTEATNDITRPYGFTFPDAGDDGLSGTGEFVATASDGGHVLDVLGEPLGFTGEVRFRFEELVEAAGIDYDTFTGLSLLAYDDNLTLINPEGSITALAGTTGFFGIASDVGIREILIHDSYGTFELDNLRFGTAVAPVPGAWALGIIGLGLVGLVRRRI